MKVSKFIFFALCFFAPCAIAQTFQTARLDTLFNLLEVKNKAMASVKMTKAGKTIYEKSIGFADSSGTGRTRATPGTRYRIGSITKTFTAVMIMQLAEENKLQLTTTLDRYFPAIAHAGQITMRMLLSHRSGIHNYTNDQAFWDAVAGKDTTYDMNARIMALKSDFKPGERMEYSNSNYVLLGWIIEKITGKTYAENLQARILDKLDLKNTRFKGKVNVAEKDSYSFKFDDGWIRQDEMDLGFVYAAGGIVSTPSEITAFMDGLFTGKLVNSESLEQMKGATEGMGLGLIEVPFFARKGYGHNGSLEAFQSLVYYFPDDQLGVAICTNGSSYAINDMAIALLSAFYKEPFDLPNLDIAKPTKEEINRYLGTYTSAAMPFKVIIMEQNGELMAEAVGQSSFLLTKSADYTFKFSQAAITVVFRPQQKEFTLNQAGTDYLFKMD